MKYILTLLAILTTQCPPLGYALDAPHTNTPGYNIECGTCHWTHKGAWSTLPNLPDAADNTLSNRKCYSCHDGSKAGVPYVKTHSTSATSSLYWTTLDGWTTQCVTCHDPHQQRQTRAWGAPTHLVTGVPPVNIGSWDTITNSTQVTVIGTIADNYYGYYFMPDKNNNYYYEIVSDTTNTDTFQVKGQVLNAYVGAGGYAIVYGKNVRESEGFTNPGGTTMGGPVKLFRAAGDNGPGDSTNTATSVCYVCHTLTLHWSMVGDTAHNDRTSCTSCHLHVYGFRASCNICHGNPPVADTLGGPDGLVSTPSATGSSSAGSHVKHATPANMNYPCNTCHYGGMPVSPVSGNNKLQIGFSVLGAGGGAYDGRTLNAPYSYEGTNGTAVTTGGSLTCSNIYCHSDGTSVSTGMIPANTSPAWGFGAIACSACHGFSPAYTNGTPKANSHPQHLAFTCDKCHSTTTNDGVTISDKTTHVNGQYNLDPGTGVSFSYSFAASGGTCSTISCHGSGSAVWGGTLACDECHGCPPDTASHLKHYGGTLAQAGYGDTRISQDFGPSATAYVMNCGNCHPLDPAKHGSGVVEVELYNPLAAAGSLKALNASSAAYSAGSTVFTDSRGFTYTQGTCNGVYCHSYTDWKTPGGVPVWTSDSLPPNLEVTRIYRAVRWGDPSLPCSGCHGNPPRTSYPDNDGGTGNSHSWIDSYGYDNLHSYNMSFDPISCSYCHYDTVNQLNTWTRDWMGITTFDNVPISNYSKHVNGVNDVALDRSKPFVYPTMSFGDVAMWLTNATYDSASKTCSNVSCHIDQTSVKWGLPYRWDTAECYRCHAAYY